MPRTSRLLIASASLVIVIAGLRSAAGVVGPVLLAVIMTILIHPLRVRLERWLPSWAAAAVTILAGYTVILALAFSLVVSIGQLAALVPRYAPDLHREVERLADRMSELGVAESHARAASDSLDVGRILEATSSFMSHLASTFSALFLVIALMLFLVFDCTHVSRLADQARVHRPELVDALVTFTRGTRTHFGVSAVFGLIVAVIDAGLLWALGVPGAFVWGVLSFVTNFIPNIGFVLGLVPPALIALLEGGPVLMLWVVVLYIVVNVVIQTFIQPRYVGSAVGLSTSLTFVSLVFWAWVLGPLGALLAVPMSLLVRAVLVDADPDGRWRMPLITGRPDDMPSSPL